MRLAFFLLCVNIWFSAVSGTSKSSPKAGASPPKAGVSPPKKVPEAVPVTPGSPDEKPEYEPCNPPKCSCTDWFMGKCAGAPAAGTMCEPPLVPLSSSWPTAKRCWHPAFLKQKCCVTIEMLMQGQKSQEEAAKANPTSPKSPKSPTSPKGSPKKKTENETATYFSADMGTNNFTFVLVISLMLLNLAVYIVG